MFAIEFHFAASKLTAFEEVGLDWGKKSFRLSAEMMFFFLYFWHKTAALDKYPRKSSFFVCLCAEVACSLKPRPTRLKCKRARCPCSTFICQKNPQKTQLTLNRCQTRARTWMFLSTAGFLFMYLLIYYLHRTDFGVKERVCENNVFIS